MSDVNLPKSGKDSKLELVVDGVPMGFTVSITRCSARAKYDTVEVKHLGTNDVDIDKEPIGWEGELEISVKDSGLDDFIDAWNLARRNRVPTLINLTNTKIFRDRSSVTHVYPDVKIEFGGDQQRGQADTIRMPWVTGLDRI